MFICRLVCIHSVNKWISLCKCLNCTYVLDSMLSCALTVLISSVQDCCFLAVNDWWITTVYSKCSKSLNPSCLPKRPRQTPQTQIRLLQKKQSDQGLLCLLFWQAFCEFLGPTNQDFFFENRNLKVFRILEHYTCNLSSENWLRNSRVNFNMMNFVCKRLWWKCKQCKPWSGAVWSGVLTTWLRPICPYI